MAQDEILNYDPLRLNRVEDIVELQEIIVVGGENTRVKSLLIPKSKLASKTKEEAELLIQHAFLVFNIDPKIVPVSAALIDIAKKQLASRYTRLFVGNLAIVYLERLARSDGKDPEMEVVEELKPGETNDERDIAASVRLIKHLQSRTEAGLINYFDAHLDLVADFCREAIVTISGQVTLSIWEEKGYDHPLILEERAPILRQTSQWRWRDYVEWSAERWASEVLTRMNPAGMPFPALRTIVRSGLEALVRRSTDDAGKILQKMTREASDKKEITFQVSADGKEATTELPNGTRITIQLPEGSPVSQDSMIELLSVLGRGGAQNVKIADWSKEELEKLGAEYVGLKPKLSRVKRDAKRLHNKDSRTWQSHLKIDYPMLEEYADILTVMGRVYFAYESDIHPQVATLEPYEIAWEIAARRSSLNYEPFSAKAETFNKHAIRPK